MIPIVYINLESAVLRRSAIDKRLGALGLVGQRIVAVTPADIPGETLRRHCDPESYNWLQPAELACSMSHVRAWATLARFGATHGVVLEDDACLSDRLPAFLAGCEQIDRLPDLIRLETSLQALRMERRAELSIAGVNIHRIHGFAGGSAAYLISMAMAARLSRQRRLYEQPIDFVLFDSFREFPRRTFHHAVPGLAIQSDKTANSSAAEPSQIKPAYAARQAARPKSSIRRFLFAARRWIASEIVTGSGKTWLDITGRGKRFIDFA